jgi:hypothetical protein
MFSFFPASSYLDRLSSNLLAPRAATDILLPAVVAMLCWSILQVTKYLLTPKPYGFVPHLENQQMVVGDAGKLAKFIQAKQCHTGEFEGISSGLS